MAVIAVPRSLQAPWNLALLATCLLLVIFLILPHPYFYLPKTVPTIPGNNGSTSPMKGQNRPLVLYAYAESENARQNLDYFVQKGVHGNADFVFIFNGPTTASDLIPRHPNIQIVKRDNTCFDLGAIGEVLMEDNLWKKYKRFITLNASIRGPFFPIYSDACWTDVFLSRITDHVKLAGLSMNCIPRPHVQSMLFATDDIGMSILLNRELSTTVKHDDHWGSKDDPVGLSVCFETLYKAVHSEIAITELIRSQGYEVDVMLTSFHGTSAKDPSIYCQENGNPDDVLYDGQYFGGSVHPYETVFMKANRGISDATMSGLTKWHLSRSVSSWDLCKA